MMEKLRLKEENIIEDIRNPFKPNFSLNCFS